MHISPICRCVLLTTIVSVLLFSFSCSRSSKEKPVHLPKSVADIRASVQNPNGEDILVIAHRGDWRYAPENSLHAIQNCIDMGIDMVEIDVRMTKDSVLVLMHDETIDRTTTGTGLLADWTMDSLQTLYLKNGAGHPTHHKIPTLKEALQMSQGKIMLNLDKCYDYFDKAYEVLEKTQTTDHVVMKGKVPVQQVKEEFSQYLDKVLFMPIIVFHEENAARILRDYQDQMNPVAFEFVFKDLESPILNQFSEIRIHGSRVWVNSLWESLNAGYEDDMAVHNPDSIYGWYVKNKVNMIQTDRPRLLIDYLRSKGLHD